MSDLTFAAVDQLVALCAAMDPPLAVSMDPASVNPPGGWLAGDEVALAVTLDATVELRCSLYLIAPDLDPRRALAKLAPLVVQLADAGVRPDGPVTPQGVVMPGDPTPLPALRFPIHLHE